MSLRLKLSLMLSAFLVLIAIFSFGTILIFDELSITIDDFQAAGEEHMLVSELKDNVTGLLEITNMWALTRDARLKKQYETRLAEVYGSYGNLAKVIQRRGGTKPMGMELQSLIEHSKVVMNSRHPSIDQNVLNTLGQMNSGSRTVLEWIDHMNNQSMDAVAGIALRSETVKREMIYALGALIFFSTLTAGFIIIRIRKSIAVPVNELLKATERVGSGELSYRIHLNRRDEFGVVSDRFDNMAADLETSNRKISQKLAETELFLSIAKIAGTTLDLNDALSIISETIASQLKLDSCAIYLLRPELKAFCLAASSSSDEGKEETCLSLEGGRVQELINSLRPVALQDSDAISENRFGSGERYQSVLAVPVIRDSTCSGIILARKIDAYKFSEDEMNILLILAHNISSLSRNAELYLSIKTQLQRQTVLYELSKAVTSVLDLEELLNMTAEKISSLLSSRICIIRLLENRRLKVQSLYGLPEGTGEDMDVMLGEGIAGWVAAKGEPLLIEDVGNMPPEMRVSHLDLRSGICVPLKAGEEIIGTLGVYDKVDQGGGVEPFTIDDLNTVEGFASITALAIVKSKIYENEVRREKEASEARKRLAILFDSVQGGIITLDRDYTITAVNKYIEDWLNIPAEELKGHNSLDIFHDKIGICPHCAAKATFETGSINSIIQSRGVNYAELTAYPVINESGAAVECVVFILDITERVLYQEETLSLYREVIQTKEYLESIIDNSADAIVATDLSGVVTSWNQGAEKTFGYAEGEVIAKPLPFIPDFLEEKEKEFFERIGKGEVLKDIETLRRKKDGTIIEVNLTLSPIKDAAGEVIGISGISRDISEKKSVEKELIRRNQELSRLFFISSAMRGTLELDKLLRMVLIAVTMSDGMGFNRAILFLVDESKNVLKGAMGVGPEGPEEAWRIWDELSTQKKTLEEIMKEIISKPLEKNTFLDRLTMRIEIPLEDDTILTRAVRERRYFNVTDISGEPYSDAVLIQQLGTQAYAIVPLISRDKVIGIIWVDNYFNRKQITDEDMKFLVSFSHHVASGIENARLFEQVKMTEQQLENIFESMSDMVYFNSKDYEIKSINKAVSRKLGLPPSEIVGKKCYEIFHGMDEPYHKCPHHKTVETKQAYIEELDDPYLGGTFLTSSSPIFDLNGEFIGSVHVVRDITELKNLQSKLVMSQKMAALGEVAAKVAHEIRNPLVSVGGFAKRLEKKLDGNLKEYAGIVVKEVDRLEGILKEILGFVKEVRLTKETIDINTLVDDVIRLMETAAHERGITLVREFGPTEVIYIDPNRMKEALVNIMSNAIQSIAGNGSIYVRTYNKGKYAAVEIRDTGKGIADADRPFIFDPFYTTKSSGTGLGLAITHRIIQEHDGMIEVESEIDKGSAFRVLIPIKEEKK